MITLQLLVFNLITPRVCRRPATTLGLLGGRQKFCIMTGCRVGSVVDCGCKESSRYNLSYTMFAVYPCFVHRCAKDALLVNISLFSWLQWCET